MNILIRADASIDIGTGHIMRCLTLADEFQKHNCNVTFVCREESGHLGEKIKEREHSVLFINKDEYRSDSNGNTESYWEKDFEETNKILENQNFDWAVIDHYKLDYRWEEKIRSKVDKVMVIDDLVDRKHTCEILLDQTFGRNVSEYNHLLPEYCQILTGTTYALIRPEFSECRESSLARRKYSEIKQLLISLGGVDKNNVTTEILKHLVNSSLPEDCTIKILLGTTSPWYDSVNQEAQKLKWDVEVLVDPDQIPHILAESDLAIGAAGSSAWERCALGLPTLMIMLADNQKDIAFVLSQCNAVILVNEVSEINEQIDLLLSDRDKLINIGKSASEICKGDGVYTVSASVLNHYDTGR